MKSANVYARIEPDVKNKAEAILEQIGIPASVAINMYYKQIIQYNGLPFKVTASLPKSVNLDLMTEQEFNDDMNKRYTEAVNDKGIDAEDFFAKFDDKVMA